MTEIVVNNGDSKEPNKVDIYEKFVIWSAMPPSERIRTGIETQEQFVIFHGIGTNTPTNWKKRLDFKPRVTALRKDWAFGKMGGVIEAIYRSALKGSAQSQKLLLQLDGSLPSKENQKQEATSTFSTEDIRFIISHLPELLQDKYYKFLRDLYSDLSLLTEGKISGLEKSLAIYEEDQEVIRKFRETNPHPEDETYYL